MKSGWEEGPQLKAPCSEYELNISAIFNNADKMKHNNLSPDNLAPFGTAVYSYLLDFTANMQLALRARGSQSSLAVRFTISEVRIQLGLRAV